jgi:TatD DNase family protein
VPFVAKQIADIKGLSVEEVAHITSRNFDALFNRSVG